MCTKLQAKREGFFSVKDLKYCRQLFIKTNAAAILLDSEMSRMVNIKNTVYRSSTLMIMSLGKSYGIYNRSSQEILDQLYQDHHIDEKRHKRFVHFLALVNELRLKLYFFRNKHDDLIQHTPAQKNIKAFGKLMRDDKVIDLFTILYEIQCFACDDELSEEVRDKIKMEFDIHLKNSRRGMDCFLFIITLFLFCFCISLLVLYAIGTTDVNPQKTLKIFGLIFFILISCVIYVRLARCARKHYSMLTTACFSSSHI